MRAQTTETAPAQPVSKIEIDFGTGEAASNVPFRCPACGERFVGRHVCPLKMRVEDWGKEAA